MRLSSYPCFTAILSRIKLLFIPLKRCRSLVKSHSNTAQVITPPASSRYPSISSTDVHLRKYLPFLYIAWRIKVALRLSANVGGILMGSPLIHWRSFLTDEAWNV